MPRTLQGGSWAVVHQHCRQDSWLKGCSLSALLFPSALREGELTCEIIMIAVGQLVLQARSAWRHLQKELVGDAGVLHAAMQAHGLGIAGQVHVRLGQRLVNGVPGSHGERVPLMRPRLAAQCHCTCQPPHSNARASSCRHSNEVLLVLGLPPWPIPLEG